MNGTLVAWTAERAIATGLETVAHGARVEIEGAGPALVTALRGDRVELAPLTTRAAVVGAAVRAAGPLVIADTDALIGRTLDGSGAPIDGRGPIVDAHAGAPVRPVFGRDPATLAAAWRRLSLGLLVFDLQAVHAMGSSWYATGPTAVAHQLLRHQLHEGRVCVIAAPGAATPAVPPLADACIHVVASADATSAQRWLVPWVALAIADGVRARGRDAVVLIDDLAGWQPHVARFADRGAWATQVAQLASRAYATARGSVSVIALARAATRELDAAFDAHLELDRAMRGHPVVRRTLVRPPIRVASPERLGRVCVDLARLDEAERVARGGALDAATAARLRRGRRAREALRDRAGASVDTVEQLAGVLAIGEIDELPVEAVAGFLDAYLGELRRDHATRLRAIRDAGRLEDDDVSWLGALAFAIAARFTPG